MALWRHLPVQLAHDWAFLGISFYAFIKDYPTFHWREFQWRGLNFQNRLGIAGGVDKNGEMIKSWQKLGVGFVEIGTVTPLPQKANPGKILDRDWSNKNLWNKMGFPSLGSAEVYYNLLKEKENIKVPIFLNIGKNRNTENEEAEQDYLRLIQHFQNIVDAFVINVSSPNTKGLRDLQNKKKLESLVRNACKVTLGKPILVKLSPDLEEKDLEDSLLGALAGGASGFILTNTTLSRPKNCKFPAEGGLSGRDLAEKSKTLLKQSLKILGTKREKLLIVSVGGVLSPKDVIERIDLGADLVQTYTGLVFYGPDFFSDTATYALGQKIEQR